MKVQRRLDHSLTLFLQRTIAAQIHLLALCLAGYAAILLLPPAYARGPDHFWACSIFLITGAMVFLTSSAYHFLHDGYQISRPLELLLEDFDHYCIYFFIAGTYTPFLLNAVEPSWRVPLLASVWIIAGLGILYTKLRPHLFSILQSRAVYTGLFVLMGGLIVIRTGDIFQRLTEDQLRLFLGGNLAYLIGAVGYATRRPILFHGVFGYHELWHLMVLAGASLHCACIYSFYA